jgi:hypothetical protein
MQLFKSAQQAQRLLSARSFIYGDFRSRAGAGCQRINTAMLVPWHSRYGIKVFLNLRDLIRDETQIVLRTRGQEASF